MQSRFDTQEFKDLHQRLVNAEMEYYSALEAMRTFIDGASALSSLDSMKSSPNSKTNQTKKTRKTYKKNPFTDDYVHDLFSQYPDGKARVKLVVADQDLSGEELQNFRSAVVRAAKNGRIVKLERGLYQVPTAGKEDRQMDIEDFGHPDGK